MSDDHRSVVRRAAPTPSGSTPVVTPLHPSVVWRSPDADALDDQYEGRAPGYGYAREGHPNADALADKIAWLEGAPGGRGVVTGSGMAAVSATLLGFLSAGDHVIGADRLYGRSARLLDQMLPRLGVGASRVDATDAAAAEAAWRPRTRMVLVEAVSNPDLRVADIEGLARLAAGRGALLAVDNTFPTPLGLRPFALGANIVIHSVTKLLAGHSDATLGWVGADTPERDATLREHAVTWGLTPSPFDCWLAERGLHSLELRWARACENAAALADHIAGLPGVAQVIHPGRPDHPEHARAARLLARPGAMVGFRLAGGRAAVNRFLRAAAHIPFAPTLGDVATTLSHPASSSHREMSPEARAALGVDEGFIRISVGIEDIALLQREFSAALAAV